MSMWSAFVKWLVAWWKEECRLGDLRAEYLRRRDTLVIDNAFGELDGDYRSAIARVREEYIKLGLTPDDIERVERDHPWVRVE